MWNCDVFLFLEYDPNVQSALNERVLQGKRKRLLETFDSLMLLYVRYLACEIMHFIRKKRILNTQRSCKQLAEITTNVAMI